MTLIVGAGLAGWRLAQALDQGWARSGNHEALVLLGDAAGPLDKIALGEWATGVRDLPPSLETSWRRPESRYVAQPAATLSLTNNTVTDATGAVHSWNRLVLAVGSEPVVPLAFAGAQDRVFAVSSREGAQGLRNRLGGPTRRILVVGGGPLGVECAWNLAGQGHRTTLVHRGPRLLEPFLDPSGSALLTRRWTEAGIDVRLGVRETACSREGDLCRVTWDGSEWDGDAVVVACGSSPRTALARSAGLVVSEAGIRTEGGWGETSHPGVFALGDCAEPLPGETPGLWEPSRIRVDRLAARWTGQASMGTATGTPVFRLKTSWPVVAWGRSSEGRTTSVDKEGLAWKAVEAPRGLVWWQILGPWADLESRVADFEAGTVALVPTADGSPIGWPDAHLVCDCHRVSAGVVRQAWKKAETLADLGRSTQAGTSCGNCRPRLLALASRPLRRRERWVQAFRKPRWRGWSWREVMGYAIDYGMVVSGVLTAVTGVIKMPGFLDALGLDQRSLPDEANMALSALLDLHDWPGVILTGLALVHGILHWGLLVNFAQSWFKKPRP